MRINIADIITIVVLSLALSKIWEILRLKYVLSREKRFKNIIHSSLHPIIIKDKKGKVIFMSKSIKSLIGISNPKNLNIENYINQEDLPNYNKFINHILKWPNEKKCYQYKAQKRRRLDLG